MNIISEKESASAINWNKREYSEGKELAITRHFFASEYGNILDDIKSRPANIALAGRVDELCMNESRTELTAALLNGATRLGLKLTEAEAQHLLAYCFRAVAGFTRIFGADNLLEAFLGGFRIAEELTEAVRTDEFVIEEANGGDGDGILIYKGWVYGVYLNHYIFSGLSHLRAPGKDSLIYVFDGLNSDFVVTDLMPDAEEEKLLDRLTTHPV